LVWLRHQHGRTSGGGQIVEDRRGSIRVIRVARKFGEWEDAGLSDGSDRSLRRGIVGADRLDGVADELEADRPFGARGVEINDAAADAELARLVNRVLSRVAGRREQIAEVEWGG